MKRYKSLMFEYYKYSIVGISCAIIDLGLLNGFIYFFPTQKTSWLTLYNTTAYTFAVLNSYIWNSKYTFKVKRNARQFLGFIIQAAVSLVIANFVFLLGLWLFGFFHTISVWLITNMAKMISMFLSSTASFLFNKFLVFRKKSSQEENLREAH